MAEIGGWSLVLALLIACGTACLAACTATGRFRLFWLANLGVYLVLALASISAAALLVALVSHQFQIAYVAQHTSLDLPLLYIISTFWAGQEGSLLLWVWLLSAASALVVWRWRHDPILEIWTVTALMVVQAFLLVLSVFASNPFVQLNWLPGDGQGLNPLLENPWMVVHPPAVFLGYVGLTVPFALALAALATNKLDYQWVRASNKWVLFGWFFLGLGNILGAQWAYVELSFGGYWAWDPVENGSLLPWLAATALLHAMIMVRRRNAFRAWSIVLAVLSFLLCFVGTFLVRSGLVESVHAFEPSAAGTIVLVFILFVALVATALLIVRWSRLRETGLGERFLSKENSFTLTAILFMCLAFVVLWGTIFPALMGLLGRRVALGAAFFNQVTPPLFLAIIVLMGVCPLIAWRGESPRSLLRNLRIPVVAALVLVLVLFVFGIRQGWALLAFAVCGFIIAATLFEWLRASIIHWRSLGGSFPRVILRQAVQGRRRYGGYIVHLGVALIALGIAGSGLYHSSQQITLAPGQSTEVAGYTITLDSIKQTETERKGQMNAALVLSQSGQVIDRLAATKSFYRDFAQPESGVAIHSSASEDVYIVLTGWRQSGETAMFQVFINGFMLWLWVGAVVMLLGGLIVLWPEKAVAAALEEQSIALTRRALSRIN